MAPDSLLGVVGAHRARWDGLWVLVRWALQVRVLTLYPAAHSGATVKVGGAHPLDGHSETGVTWAYYSSSSALW
jgi:hypothetical protein